MTPRRFAGEALLAIGTLLGVGLIGSVSRLAALIVAVFLCLLTGAAILGGEQRRRGERP